MAYGKGITPAHAGKTLPFLLPLFLLWDHPRACGENRSRNIHASEVRGSPPRMRGKLGAHNSKLAYPWITPAHAGKTLPVAPGLRSCRDYPRACGENDRDIGELAAGRGSPPRMRGKPDHPEYQSSHRGITPAHAGKTNLSGDGELFGLDHPRVCGENTPQRCQDCELSGSPPRVRGKLKLYFWLFGLMRITPACAGKTNL